MTDKISLPLYSTRNWVEGHRAKYMLLGHSWKFSFVTESLYDGTVIIGKL